MKDINTMTEYCTQIKRYIELYNSNKLNVDVYGNAIDDLKKLLQKKYENQLMFPTEIIEFVGKITRVLSGNYNIESLNWVGSTNDVLSEKNFKQTMKQIWPEL